jgi:hypothetical protein
MVSLAGDGKRLKPLRDSGSVGATAINRGANESALPSLRDYDCLLVYFNRIDDADDGGINRAILAAESQPRRTALNDQHGFLNARADRINGDNVTFFIFAVDADEPRDKQLAPVQPLVFARGDDRSNNAC